MRLQRRVGVDGLQSTSSFVESGCARIGVVEGSKLTAYLRGLFRRR